MRDAEGGRPEGSRRDEAAVVDVEYRREVNGDTVCGEVPAGCETLGTRDQWTLHLVGCERGGSAETLYLSPLLVDRDEKRRLAAGRGRSLKTCSERCGAAASEVPCVEQDAADPSFTDPSQQAGRGRRSGETGDNKLADELRELRRRRRGVRRRCNRVRAGGAEG